MTNIVESTQQINTKKKGGNMKLTNYKARLSAGVIAPNVLFAGALAQKPAMNWRSCCPQAVVQQISAQTGVSYGIWPDLLEGVIHHAV